MRMSVFSHDDAFLFDLSPADVFECVRTEEVNGEHSLSVTTTARLSQGQRVLERDAAGKWREYVVTGADERHENGSCAIGTYHCVWSVQHDLSVVYGDERRPGVQGNPVSCAVALAAALDGTARWTVGRCDVSTSGGVMMYNNSAWERVADVVAEFGGELDARITVDGQRVTKREVLLYEAQGSAKATRRFDWGRDATSVRRTPPEGARVSRIVPVGKGEPRAKEASEKTSADKLAASDVSKLEKSVASWQEKARKLERETIPADEDAVSEAQSDVRAKESHYNELMLAKDKDGNFKYDESSSTVKNAATQCQKAENRLARARNALKMHRDDLADAKAKLSQAQADLSRVGAAYAAQQAAEADAQKRKEAAERDDDLYGANRKVTIADANNGVGWLQDDEADAAFRLPDGSGGWEHPCCIVENGDIDDPAALKAWAQARLHEFTRPSPTYEATVLQFAEAGMDAKGVALGDAVHVVDSGFNPSVPLRIEARVVKVATNLLDPSDVRLTVGALREGAGDRLRRLEGMVEAARGKLEAVYAASGGAPSTAQYLDYLLGQINAKLNATGGYTYVVPGEGLLCYDREVSDPAAGAEATRVVQLKGGAIRIASARTASGDWDWQLVMTAEDGLLAEAVTAAQITTGFIGSPSGNYWNLDTGELSMAATATLKDKDGNELPVEDVVELAQTGGGAAAEAAAAKAKAEKSIAKVDVEYAQNASRTAAPGTSSTLWQTACPAYAAGKYIWTRMKVTNGAGTVTYSDPQMISGADGQKGDQGVPGEKGKDGTTYYTHIAYATSVTLKDGKATACKGFTTANATDRAWIGTCVDTSSTDPSDWRRYAWQYAKGANGAKGVGVQGPAGKSAYLHVAYADSADGSAYFSTTTAKNRDYVGYCTDGMVDDPDRSTDGKDWPSKNRYKEPWKKYTWQLTAGLEGASPKTIVEQYVMTASDTTRPADGAAWSANCPQWQEGRYIWTRSKVTWSTGAVTYTSAVLAKALNTANMNAWKALTQEVGGTNLLIDSNVPDLGRKAATDDRIWTHAENASQVACKVAKSSNLPVPGNVGAYFRFDMAAGASGKFRGVRFYNRQVVALRDGQKYTASCMARCEEGQGKAFFLLGKSKWVKSDEHVLDREWRRYSWTFTYRNADTGGSGGAFLEFSARAAGAAKGVVVLCGLKLESGEKATAWSANPEDVRKSAVDEAEKWAGEEIKSLAKLTDGQVKALNAAVTQEGIFKTLCQTHKGNNFAVMQGGKYYINGTWIKSGTVDAGVLRAGVIASKGAWDFYAKHGKSFGEETHWNLATGHLQTKGMVARNAHIEGAFTTGGAGKLMMKDGRLYGYSADGKTCHGWIDYSAEFLDLGTGKTLKGIKLRSQNVVGVCTRNVTVFHSDAVSRKALGVTSDGYYPVKAGGRRVKYASGTYVNALTGRYRISVANDKGSGTVELDFVDGLLVGAQNCSGKGVGTLAKWTNW